MRWMRWGVLEEISPLGLLATGLVIGAGTPVIKKGLRSLAVFTAKGILTVSDSLKETGEQASRNYQQLVLEAREQQEINKCNIREHLHTAGITAVKGGLTVADEIQEVINTAKEKLNKYVEEARQDLKKTVMQVTVPEAEKEETLQTCHCSNENNEDLKGD